MTSSLELPSPPTTESQQRILNIVVRIAAGISFAVASTLIYQVLSSKYYRRRIFHRIMVGCATNILILNANQLWGQAAVPAEYTTAGFPYAKGTQTTCSIQGFFMTLTIVAPYYYSALSILCFVAVQYKFQAEKYKWVEICIHIIVYIMPIASSLYLLSVQGYNPSYSICTYGSYPNGCGDQSISDEDGTIGIECLRGPNNFGQISRLLGGLQIGIVGLLPTVIMSIVYCKVRLFQGPRGRQVASSVAYQTFLYMFALYWTFIPKFVFWGITYKADTFVFESLLVSNIFDALQGVWFYLPYYCLRSDDPIAKLTTGDGTSRRASEDVTTAFDESGRSGGLDSVSDKDDDDGNDKLEQQPPQHCSNQEQHQQPYCRTFSIFDGSINADPDSPWSQYLYDEGEDDSYQEENNGERNDTEFDI